MRGFDWLLSRLSRRQRDDGAPSTPMLGAVGPEGSSPLMALREDSDRWAAEIESRTDVFSNHITGMQRHNSKTSCNSWDWEVGRDYWTISNFTAYSGVASRIVNRGPEDALRKGITIPDLDIDQNKDLSDFLQSNSVVAKIILASQLENLFGGAIITMKIEDGGGWEDEVNPTAIKSIGALTVFDRWDVSIRQFTTDMDTGERYVPQAYFINENGMEVHPSRVILFPGKDLDARTRRNRGGWGVSDIDAIWDKLEQYNVVQKYLAEAVTRATQGVFTMNGVNVVGKTEGKERVLNRFKQLGKFMGLLGDIVLDENEKYEVVQRSMQGFREAFQVAEDALVAETPMPKSILLGQTPTGLNSGDNSGDWQTWTTHLDGQRTSRYETKFRRYLDLLFDAGNSPLSDSVERYDIKWPDLLEVSMLDRATALSNIATAATTLTVGGVVTELEARENPDIQRAFPASDDTKLPGEGEDVLGEVKEEPPPLLMSPAGAPPAKPSVIDIEAAKRGK